jgi:hypothetical protein
MNVFHFFTLIIFHFFNKVEHIKLIEVHTTIRLNGSIEQLTLSADSINTTVILNSQEHTSEVGHCRKCGGFDAGFAESAVDRRVIFTLILFQVEVNNLCTVSNILTDVVESVRLNTGGERSHLSLFTLVPDDTLNETLTSADGKKSTVVAEV